MSGFRNSSRAKMPRMTDGNSRIVQVFQGFDLFSSIFKGLEFQAFEGFLKHGMNPVINIKVQQLAATLYHTFTKQILQST